MRRVARLVLVALVATVAAVLIAVSQTMTSIVVLAATAFYMGGTQHPLSVPPVGPDTQAFVNQYVTDANTTYVAPSGLCGNSTGCATNYAIVTPEQFFPVFGSMTFDQSLAAGRQNLDSCLRGDACTYTRTSLPPTGSGTVVGGTIPADTRYVVIGYSQSATVATLEKRNLLKSGNALPPGTTTGFVLIANPDRPNGGILERFNFGDSQPTIPILGVTFYGATPTDSPGNGSGAPTMPTVDVTRQYDGYADFPTNPLNLLADLNALAGIALLHPNYIGVGTPQLQGQYGDTTYYLIPTQTLPLLMPLESIPLIGPALAATLDPTLRVLVEAGYDRTINPGEPTTANFLYSPNPITFGTNLVLSIAAGLQNGMTVLTGGTLVFDPTHPYGVGGPQVDTGCEGSFCAGGPTPFAPVQPGPVTSTQPTAPTTPLLLASPKGFIALSNPTMLMTDLAKFSQLTSVLNGGVPVSIPSPVSTPEDVASLVTPMPALADVRSSTEQSATTLGHSVPDGPSTNATGSSSTAKSTQLAAAHNVDTTRAGQPGRQAVEKNNANDIGTQVKPAPKPTSVDKTDSDAKRGPRLGSIGKPFVTQPSTDATAPSQPKLTNPTESGLSGVRSSKESTFGGVSKASTTNNSGDGGGPNPHR